MKYDDAKIDNTRLLPDAVIEKPLTMHSYTTETGDYGEYFVVQATLDGADIEIITGGVVVKDKIARFFAENVGESLEDVMFVFRQGKNSKYWDITSPQRATQLELLPPPAPQITEGEQVPF